MGKFPLSLSEVKALHQSGQLIEAKKGYLDLLEMDNQQTDAWHFLGILHAESGEFGEAYDCLTKAIELEPEDASLYLHLANILKSQGLFEAAIQLLQKAILISPKFSALQNNLGSIYFAQDDWINAIKHYQLAIDLQPNYIDAYYNLGLALNRAQRYEEAFNTFQSLLELSPLHAGGLFKIGCLLMKAMKYEKALQSFKILEADHPFHYETQVNLAHCYLRLGQLNAAKTHYLKALEIIPDDTQSLFNLGVISMQQGRLQDVFTYYQRALTVNPNLFEVHNNLAVSYLAIKDNQTALTHFKEALRLQPDNKSVQYSVTALKGGQSLSRADVNYVEQLFDSYADHYDQHLTSELGYALPKDMYTLALETIKPVNKMTILDLGCGTGLCGPLFKLMASQLIGVDLSNKMLKEAEAKHCYDQLIHQDALDFLKTSSQQYNLVLAADVIVYFGQLDSLFSAVHPALDDEGWFLFNYESGANQSYELQETGRFKHNKAYLTKLVSDHDFELVAEREVTVRLQQGVPVMSHVYLLKKLCV